SPSGPRYVEHGEILELVAPERLVFTLINEDDRGEVMFRTKVEVTFGDREGRTVMTFVQVGLESGELRESLRAGWISCLDKLDQNLAAEREIRVLFEEWFRASERKDLDATMAAIADDVLSYEHQAPLSHHGADAVRASCKIGFDRAPETFRWDVPDLRIVVRG